MIKKEERLIIRAISLAHRPFLKPEEARIYVNLSATQFTKKMCRVSYIQNRDGLLQKGRPRQNVHWRVFRCRKAFSKKHIRQRVTVIVSLLHGHCLQ